MLEPELVREAQEFAKSDAVEELLRRLEAKHTEIWKATAPETPEVREQCYHLIRAIDALRQELVSVAQSDKVAEFNRRVARNVSLR